MKAEANPSLLFWWPLIKSLPIRQPKTAIVKVGSDVFCDFLDSRNTLAEFTGEFERAIQEIGYPLFLRTDIMSAKHSWVETCFVPDRPAFQRNLFRLIDENLAAFCDEPSALVFREYIPMATEFTAFGGGLPIGVERRYFVADGEVLCHHPYWIEEAVEKGRPNDIRWREKLQKLNEETREEIVILSGLARQVARVLPGYWSVDFCLSASGEWVLIDCAPGALSWHPDCALKGGA